MDEFLIADESIATPAEASDADGEKGTPSKAPSMWKARIAKSRRYKRTLIEDWKENIDRRRGKVFASDSDQDRIAITFDWSATKAKQAQLFSQVPKVRLKAKKKTYAGAIPVFAKKLNDTIDHAEVGTAMDECLPDCINAAGYALAMVTYETRSVDKDLSPKPAAPILNSPIAPPAPPVAAAPPQVPGNVGPAAPGLTPGMPTDVGMPPAPPAEQEAPIPYTTAKRIICDRLSPSDGLWDLTFAGSNFNRSPWVGRSGRMHWSRAYRELKIPLDKKAVAIGTGVRSAYERLTDDLEKDNASEAEMVEFEEIFYWRYLFHDDETSFEAIQRMVFVRGIDEPTINEPWSGQKRLNAQGQPDPQGDIIVGACKFPIQFLTLTYLTDEAIPPSDTAMGRPQVDELIQGRTDMMLQRRHSRPMRWFDNNKVVPEMVQALMRGTWQGMIPTNGPGDRAIGEVARAAYPREDDTFDRIAKVELNETWSIGGAQGNGGGQNTQIRTAAEANNAQANMNTRVSYERARVNRFFLNLSEVIAGLLCLFGDWDEEELQGLQGMDIKHMPNYYTYTTRVDSSVLIDAQSRYTQLEGFVNMTAKSGLVDETVPIKEMASLIDLDEEIVQQPQGKGPEPVNVSLRLDSESFNDPMMVAMLIKSGQMPSPQEIDAAKKVIIESRKVTADLVQQPGAPPAGGPPAPGAPPAPGGPQAQPAGQEANPEWDMASRVNKRQQDGR